VSRKLARLVVARATHPPLDQSGASAASPRAPASTGASARSGVSGEQGTDYEQQPPTTERRRTAEGGGPGRQAGRQAGEPLVRVLGSLTPARSHRDNCISRTESHKNSRRAVAPSDSLSAVVSGFSHRVILRRKEGKKEGRKEGRKDGRTDGRKGASCARSRHRRRHRSHRCRCRCPAVRAISRYRSATRAISRQLHRYSNFQGQLISSAVASTSSTT